ncbi:carbohydrate ABC transporter permease [Actinomadura parmotrematis]|uniref:Carbohydrate ABC transporter permease n=1 Tax=Actinomadura parmotrematis TaxID=2864039 RepID=A0ABS7G4L2_9ACTN|nr:carbohydrate ABC transporter permease [Actinomadura parmotrematis]MBW8486732.1 carbohydrate ABC transporter permease [Actinomadura parmotrematis]
MTATGAPARRPTARTRTALARTVVYALLAGYAVVSLFPFAWMVSGSLKTDRDMLDPGAFLPAHPTVHVLADTWRELDFFGYFLNSLKVTGLTVLGVLVVYSLASYAFGVLRFPGRTLLYRFFVALLFVPSVTMLLPVVLLESEYNLLGTHLGLVLPLVNGTAPLSILLLTTAFAGVPRELREAAMMDGAGEARVFWSVYLPAVRPALVTVAMLTAIPTWNEYLLSRVSLDRPGTFTLPIALQNLTNSGVPQYNVLMAGALIVVVPVIILFCCLQRYFVNGLVGAVKG